MTPALAPVNLQPLIDTTIRAFQSRDGHSLNEMRALDTAYLPIASLDTSKALVESTALYLFQQKYVFDNLHFSHSLVTGGSAFYGAVLRFMGDLASNDSTLAASAALPVKIRLVEHYRRSQNGEKMSPLIQELEKTLAPGVQANDTLALTQLAKVRYEQSMYAYNLNLFDEAIKYSTQSEALCEKAGDIYGVLAARGNSAGPFTYTRARFQNNFNDPSLQEGKATLLADIEIARTQRLAQDSESILYKNFERVEMNNACHLMNIADIMGSVDVARKTWDILSQNTLFKALYNPNYPDDPQQADAVVRNMAAMLKRLEDASK